MYRYGVTKKRYRSMTREERADLIDDCDIETIRPGREWEMASQSNPHEHYCITKSNKPCIRRACGDLDLCHHLYKCDCPDEENPCKHIFKIHSSFEDQSESDSESDEVETGDDESSSEDESTASVSRPLYTPQEVQQFLRRDVAKITSYLDELRNMLVDPRFSFDMTLDIKTGLKAIVEDARHVITLPRRY